MLSKTKLTNHLVELLPGTLQLTKTQALKTWWQNIRDTGGFRLTPAGFEVFTKHLELDSYTVEIDTLINANLLLKMDRKISCPYYFENGPRKKTQSITLFGSREALMVNLYGSFNDWLDNCEFRYNGPGS